MAASITIGSLSLASDGKTLTGTLSGGSSYLPATGATGFTVSDGTYQYQIASIAITSLGAVTLNLAAFIPGGKTVTVSLATSSGSNVTDGAGDTPTGQSNVGCTYSGGPSATQIPYNDSNVFVSGPISTGTDFGLGYFGFNDTNANIQFKVSTTDASILLLGQGPITVTIDGGSPFTITPIAGYQWVKYGLFFGLSASAHTVNISGGTGLFATTLLFEVVGSSVPSLPPFAGYGPYLLLNSAPFTTYSIIDGPSSVFNGYVTFTAENLIRFTAAVTDIFILIYCGAAQTDLDLYQDGNYVGTTNIHGLLGYVLYHVASGLDGQSHSYEFHVLNSIAYTSTSIYAIMLGGGTGLVHQTQTPKDVWAFYGDSITANWSLTDPTYGDAWIVAHDLGVFGRRFGNPGDDVSTFLRDNTSQVTSISPTPKTVWVRGGTNDLGSTGNETPLSTFQADFLTMLQNIRSGLPLARIFVEEIFPTTRTPGTYGSRSQYNACIAAAFASFSDTNSVLINTDNWFNPSNPTYSTDGVHPLAPAYALMANREIPYGASTGYTVSGPATGVEGSHSTNFTVTMASGATFTGDQTVTITSSNSSDTIAPSVGSSGTGSVTVTPTNGATSFTFTLTRSTAGTSTLTFTNGQGWTDPSTSSFTASSNIFRRTIGMRSGSRGM